MTLRRGWFRVRALAIIGVLLALLSPAAVPAAAQEKQIFRIGTTQDLDSLNPFQAYLYSSYEAWILNYDVLVGFGPNLEYAPTGFATSWDVSDDGKTYTFQIRDGMKWSDGQPATARDVEFTYNYILDSLDTDDALTLFTLSLVTSVKATSDTELVIELSDSSSLILGAYTPILPEHIWSKVTPKQANADFQNSPPVVGTGPFQAIEWQKGQFARFARNENYWGPKSGIDEVQMIFFANQDAMDQALIKGDLDAARQILPSQFNQIDGDANIVGVNGNSPVVGFDQIAWNLYDSKGQPGIGASTSATRDQKFRDALGYAIDKELLVRQALLGFGTPGTTAVPPALQTWHWEPPAEMLRTFNLDEAKKRLDAAGYKDSNGDGFREDLDGKEINLNLVTPSSQAYYAQSANLIADWWGQVGIKLSVQVLDKDTVTKYVTPPEADGKANFDVELWGWGGVPDPDFQLSIFTTEQIGGWSDSFYSNPEYDALYKQQQIAPTQEARKALTDKMQEILYRDAPYDVLYYSSELQAYRTDTWHGYANQPRQGGTPFFTYGVESYVNLQPGPEPSPSPAAPSATAAGSGSPGAPTAAPSPSASPSQPASGGGGLPLIIGGVALVAVLAIGFVMMRGRRARDVEEE